MYAIKYINLIRLYKKKFHKRKKAYPEIAWAKSPKKNSLKKYSAMLSKIHSCRLLFRRFLPLG